MSTSTESEVAEAQEKAPIQLEVTVESPQACLREVVVTIPEAEVQRYLKDAYDELVPEAQVRVFAVVEHRENSSRNSSRIG